MRSLYRIAVLLPFLLRVLPVGSVPTKDCAHKVKETVDAPRGWVKHGEPPADHKIALKIGLPQPNFSELEKHLYEVSDPDHARYGHHLSKVEVEELVAPYPESLDTVNEWLSSLGFDDEDMVRSPAKDWITINVPVSKAEEMLNTKYYVWKHVESGDYLLRTTSYSLPSNVHEHIELVQPTTMFGRFKPQRSNIFKSTPFAADIAGVVKTGSTVNAASGVSVDASCNQIITITCLQQLYNAVGFTPSAKDNSIGITGYLEQFANMQDLQSFFADQRPDAVNSTFKVISVAGGLNNQSLAAAGDEADLDVEFAFGLSHPIAPTFFTTAGRPPFIPDLLEPAGDNENEPYLTWLDFILEMPDPPLTISTSYGDNEQTVPFTFAQRACSQFAQLGARGVSILFASGDFGVGDGDENPATQECITNDGTNQTKFIPSFPASCPFVTSVGGTSHIPEVAVSTFFSGGGFSNYFARPSFQDKDVTAYLNSLPKGTYAGLFNPNGRGIPDVSAQSDLFKVFIGGEAFLIGGTSAATPTFSAFISLLNDVRLKAGLPSLGFLNPFLYSKGFAGLNDITSGNNGGCGTPGFNASKGWDPVTGLGTPNFGELRKLVL